MPTHDTLQVHRAQLQQNKTTTLVDFYVSGTEYGPTLMDTALSFTVNELRNTYGINVASAPVAVTASSPANQLRSFLLSAWWNTH